VRGNSQPKWVGIFLFRLTFLSGGVDLKNLPPSVVVFSPFVIPDLVLVRSIHLHMDTAEGLISTVAAKREAWTVPELAKLLSLSKGEVYQQIKSGKLPAIKIGTNIRLCPKITSEWLRSRLTA
jgi:excisionase family DNA binding protein